MTRRAEPCRIGWRIALSGLLLCIVACSDRNPSGTSDEPSSTSSAPATEDATAPPPVRSSGRVQTGPQGSVLIEPAVVDFGALGAGSVNTATFRITNTGSTPATIQKVNPSCVCTTLTDLAGTTIGAGRTVTLDASLDAPKQAGEKEAKVFVYLQGSQRPAVVSMQGVVTLPVQPEPAYADALKGKIAGTIQLRSTDGRPFQVISSNGGSPTLVGGGDGGAAAEHTVVWTVAGMPGSSIPKWWIFTTDHPDQPLVAARVRNENTGSKRDPTRITRRWIVLDDFAEFGEVRVGDVREFTVQMDHYNPRGGGQVDRPEWSTQVTVASTDPRVTASLGEVSLEAKGDLRIGSVKVVVKVRFNGPPCELLYVPIALSSATGTQIVEVAARVLP